MTTDTTDTTDPCDGLCEADRVWLGRTAAELRAKLRRSVQEVVESGRLLAMARRRLGRHRWRPWLAGAAQIPVRSAARLVNVGEVFSRLPESAVARFTPTALYALAEPGVPKGVREYFVQAARDGDEVTAKDVAEMLDAARQSVEPKTKAEERRLMKLAPDDDVPADDYHDPADVFSRENWHLLRELVGQDGTVHITGCPDAENDDEAYSGYVLRRVGPDAVQRRHASGGTVESVVLKLAGGVRKKVCAVCGVNKPLDEYCKRTDMPDGREYRCKRCEATRVKAHTARKAAARRAAG